MSTFCLQIEGYELRDGSCHGISPSSLTDLPLTQIRGGSSVKFTLFSHHLLFLF